MQRCATGSKLRDLDAETLFKHLPTAINQIGVITGLKVESSPEFARAFAHEVSMFLYNHHGILTLDEVVLAFRLNAAGEYGDTLTHYGQNLTIDHIGRVLRHYISRRLKLASKLQEQKMLPEPVPPTSEQIDEEARMLASHYFGKYLRGEMTEINLEYAHLVYDDLTRFGMLVLDNEQKWAYYREAQSFRKKELSLPAATREQRHGLRKLLEAYLKKEVPKDELRIIGNYAKRLALMDYFKRLKSEGIQEIFEDERVHEATFRDEIERQETGEREAAKENSPSQQEEATD